ncbi:uncharacterized protein LOC143519240 [Brachyhypopomus gauderio]|uniref:uncharacterized protein LOC143519240 n=1 Tax=Brachyhypopomus gauderio TaxID=698409 RepID=UPI0040416A1A
MVRYSATIRPIWLPVWESGPWRRCNARAGPAAQPTGESIGFQSFIYNQLVQRRVPAAASAFSGSSFVFLPDPTDMIIRLGRLTPGYFHLLQRQVAGDVQALPPDRSLNQLAMILALLGLSVSFYSAKQLRVKAQQGPGS